MYGISLPSVLSTSTTTPYVTTLDTMLAFRRICDTLPVKRPVAVGVDLEGDLLPDVDVADVGLVDRRPDLHVAQVLGQEEQAGRVQPGHHGLAHVHAAVDHHAVDGRADGGVIEIDLGLLLRALGLLDLGLAHGQLRLGDLVLRLGGLVFGLRVRASQSLGAMEVAFRLVPVRAALLELGLGQPQAGHGLLQLGLWGRSSSWASTSPSLTREL